MIATVRETWRSLLDLKYGSVAVKRTVGESLWYWTKYLLVVAVIGLLAGVAALTYFAPQLAGLVEKNFPEIEAKIKDGRVETNVPQPFIQGNEDFVMIINTKGNVDDLDSFKTGMLLLEDKLVAKSENETRIIDLKDLEGVEVNKSKIVDWIGGNQAIVLSFGAAAIVSMAIVLTALFWLSRLVSFFVTAVLVWLCGLLLKKSLTYLDAVKITIHASVLPFLLSSIFFFFPNEFVGWLLMVVFLFYSLAWVYYLPAKSSKTK